MPFVLGMAGESRIPHIFVDVVQKIALTIPFRGGSMVLLSVSMPILGYFADLKM